MSGLKWVILTTIFLFVGFQSVNSAKKPPTLTKEKVILLLGLDGIGESTMLKMYEGGYFRQFRRPIPMVASFPSISDPNWAHMMQAPLEKSYTKAHFEFSKNTDGSVGEDVGNLMNHLTTPPQYEKKFDFKPEGLFQHLMTMTWSETSALFWTDALTRILMEPANIKHDFYKAFIVSTDIVSHTHGEQQVLDYLKALDKRLKKLQEKFEDQYDKTLEIVIASDHGNYFTKPKAIDFDKFLKPKGFVLSNTLKNKNDYAYVASEIISFGSFYTLPGQEKTLAQSFAQIPEVHVTMINEGKNKIRVFSQNGETQILIDPKKQRVSYKLISGEDPFDQIELFKNKSSYSWEEYFYKTLDDEYPNALVRAWEGFYKNAVVPGSVLVSPRLGYVFTNLTLELLTALSGVHSTHGSFAREETMGMVISTIPTSKEAITPFEFQDLLKNLSR
jgi:hypothetical protein